MFKQFMKGKCYPFRPEQWPDVVLKGMDLLNRYNWFPFCTFILGLPGETDQDTKESLDLLFALKDAKWCVIPTLFVPFEETRLGQKEGASIFTLTDLQWEFFFTCWRYNIDFTRGACGGILPPGDAMLIKIDTYHDGKFWCARGIGEDIFTQGRTVDELFENIKEAVALHFENGRPPSEIDILVLSELKHHATTSAD